MTLLYYSVSKAASTVSYSNRPCLSVTPLSFSVPPKGPDSAVITGLLLFAFHPFLCVPRRTLRQWHMHKQ
jgi:hypothetical protein